MEPLRVFPCDAIDRNEVERGHGAENAGNSFASENSSLLRPPSAPIKRFPQILVSPLPVAQSTHFAIKKSEASQLRTPSSCWCPIGFVFTHERQFATIPRDLSCWPSDSEAS